MYDEQNLPPLPPPQDYHDDRMSFMNQEQTESAIIFQLDPQHIIEGIEHSLKSEKYDAKKDIWYRSKNIKPMLNDEGVEFIMGEIRKVVNTNTFLSNLTDNSIDKICADMHKYFTDVLMLRWKEWEVEKSMLKPIVYGTMHTVFIALQRCQNKTTLDYLKKSTQIRETINRDEQNRKRRFGIF
jgi:hypothetical protein